MNEIYKNNELEILLDYAPEDLSRQSGPMLIEPDILSILKESRFAEFKESFLKGKTKISHVDARDFLKLCLEHPKSSLDYYGNWILSFPYDFFIETASLFVGKKQARPTNFWKPANSGEILFRKIRPWMKKFWDDFEQGLTYEVGFISVGQNNNSALLSVSIPYERRSLSNQREWWKKITSNEFKNFVGRENILAIFKRIVRNQLLNESNDETENLDLFGNIIDNSKITKAFEQNEEEMWWGEAINCSRIISAYRSDARKLLDGPSLGQKVFRQLKKDGLTEILTKHILAPRFFTAYYIRKNASILDDSPGNFSLHLSDQNWSDFKYFEGKGERFGG